MKKEIDMSEEEKILKESHNLGIKNSVNFIVGHPLEEDEDVNETINFLRKNISISQINLSRFALMYDSYIFNHPEEYKITNLKNCEFPLTYIFDDTRYDHKERMIKTIDTINKIKKLFQNKAKINISI